MRVVADTNVIVSAMLWIGSPHQILVASEDARLTLCTSPSLLRELTGVLSRPKFAPRLRALQVSVSELTTGYARLARLVNPQRIMRVVAEDPADDEVLACALAARAHYIVSGDTDLLRVRSYRGISILSPHLFVQQKLSRS
ncbi:MAG: putative toxin-antitoxin system toxin component, PIN family [Nitrospirae bacterium]|nr:putative toxin-antitoxin system toxin component, PIN family [Nitrospirota bacterium]